MLEQGERAPDFELNNQDGELVSLSDLKGEKVVLYFYPKADTPGCTKEACGFRDSWEDFEESDIEVIGVSTDPVEDLKEFKEKYDLPFTLLSDERGEVASAYESYGTTEVGDETWEIAFRNTYVIDEDGYIERVYKNVSPEGHADEIIEELT